MPPLAIDVMEAHRAALLRADDAAMRAMAQRWLQIERALQAQVDALILEILQQGGGPLTMWQLVRLRRYQTLLEQLNIQAAQFVDYVTQDITTRQRTAGMEAIDQSSLAISAAAADAGIQLQFDRLPVSNVERMVGLAGDGSPLRTILQSASTTGADALAQQLIQGVALGLNPREIARRAMRQGLATSFTRMVTIARTEVLRVARQTTLENYRHSQAVRAYRRVASKSQRTCIACLALDGEIYPLTTPFEEHVNGRCVPVPVLIRGTPLPYENGKDWFARQPETVQRQMMGPGRWDLWQAGDVGWNDLVRIHQDETWGNSPQVTPVRDLEQRAGRQAVRPQRTRRTPQQTQTPAPMPQNRATMSQVAALLAQPTAVQDAERQIYQLRTHEEAYIFDADGNVTLQKRGGQDYVEFTPEELAQFDGMILTHNHPLTADGTSFSAADVRLAATYKLAEVRAVGGRYVHSLRMDRGLEWADIEPLYLQTNAAVYNEFYRQITLGTMTTDEASLRHHHEVWSRLANLLQTGQWLYERQEHNY